jgi:hypothetical protein
VRVTKIPCPDWREIRAVCRNALKARRELPFRHDRIGSNPENSLPNSLPAANSGIDPTWTRFAASAKVSNIHQE